MAHAQPAVAMFGPQEFKIMRRKIDHQQLAARHQHTRRLGNRVARRIEVVQHLVHDHEIGRGVLERRRRHVAEAHPAVADAGAFQICARHGQHLVAEIDAFRFGGPARKQEQHAPRSRAEIDYPPVRPRPGEIEQCVLDGLVGKMQGAQRVPILGDAGEEDFRRGCPRVHHFMQLVAISLKLGCIRAHLCEQLVKKSEPRARACCAVKDERTFRQPLGEAGFRQALQVVRQARLALPEHLNQLAHRKVIPAQQRKQAQPGRLARCFQLFEKVIYGNHHLII